MITKMWSSEEEDDDDSEEEEESDDDEEYENCEEFDDCEDDVSDELTTDPWLLSAFVLLVSASLLAMPSKAGKGGNRGGKTGVNGGMDAQEQIIISSDSGGVKPAK